MGIRLLDLRRLAILKRAEITCRAATTGWTLHLTERGVADQIRGEKQGDKEKRAVLAEEVLEVAQEFQLQAKGQKPELLSRAQMEKLLEGLTTAVKEEKE
ncbi:MAG: hypothetical protein HY652_02850 [Acidobacteria bacterium]|nr:hypothetical protein [Acidobacteriota bacterium]